MKTYILHYRINTTQINGIIIAFDSLKKVNSFHSKCKAVISSHEMLKEVELCVDKLKKFQKENYPVFFFDLKDFWKKNPVSKKYKYYSKAIKKLSYDVFYKKGMLVEGNALELLFDISHVEIVR